MRFDYYPHCNMSSNFQMFVQVLWQSNIPFLALCLHKIEEYQRKGGTEPEQDPPPSRTSPQVLCLPFVCGKLQSKDNFNQRNEHIYRQRKTAKGDWIIIMYSLSISRTFSSFSRAIDNILSYILWLCPIDTALQMPGGRSYLPDDQTTHDISCH